MIAWAMNGEALAPLHGFPLRLVIGGWPGSVSGKWLTRILIRDRVHDGAKMGGQSYRVPCNPVAPGATVPDEDMCIIRSMPVKSLITFPESGACRPISEPITVRGHAWAGDRAVRDVFTSIDYGATWQRTVIEPPANRLAWQQWSTWISPSRAGYYEVLGARGGRRGRVAAGGHARLEPARLPEQRLPSHRTGGRMRLKAWCAVAAMGFLAGGALAAAPDPEIDASTGLVKAGAWEEVRAYCGGCHSVDLVASQHNDAEGWAQTIRTMQRLHNMVELPGPTEARIVDYLAKHFAPETRVHRRAPLPVRLMPRPRMVAVGGGRRRVTPNG